MSAYPHSGVCERCRRERDDLFFHEAAQAFYCADIARCEYRYYLQGEREAQGLPYRALTRVPAEATE